MIAIAELEETSHSHRQGMPVWEEHGCAAVALVPGLFNELKEVIGPGPQRGSAVLAAVQLQPKDLLVEAQLALDIRHAERNLPDHGRGVN